MDQREKWKLFQKIRIVVFFVCLFGGMLLGAIYVLRPNFSKVENRKLEEFPSFQIAKLWSGEYFDKLTTWYADTYPFREKLLTLNDTLEEGYGLQEEQITGDAILADEIPTVDGEWIDNVEVEEKEESVGEDPVEKEEESVGESPVEKEEDLIEEESIEKEDGTGEGDATEKVEDPTISKKDITAGETFGSVYVTKERAFSLYYFSLKSANNYAKAINSVAKQLDGVATVYDLLAPTSVGIYLDEEKSKLVGTSNQKDAFSYIYSKLSKKVVPVDVYDAIKEHADEYIYFRTDHHWTALGAYYAYEKFCEDKGIQPNTLDQFEKHKYKNFLGSYYAASNQSKILKKKKDTIETYVPMGTNTMKFIDRNGEEHTWPIVNDVSKYANNAKYSTFAAGDNPYATITNSKSKTKDSCIVIKESYGNAMIPFLVDHYRKIYIIDYRYYEGNIISLVKKKKIKDVIFINNAEAINNQVVDRIKKISKK
ncbi:DHHW family protein [Anaerosporobacter faecicola]|uniref:DHHW family protein n=1 Tax=Anaerosporobacter faecicola TaxID=2718714 RepID=UPI001439B61F|nr:DHHW family protein [Anaerosporobacter faecicola]